MAGLENQCNVRSSQGPPDFCHGCANSSKGAREFPAFPEQFPVLIPKAAKTSFALTTEDVCLKTRVLMTTQTLKRRVVQVSCSFGVAEKGLTFQQFVSDGARRLCELHSYSSVLWFRR